MTSSVLTSPGDDESHAAIDVPQGRSRTACRRSGVRAWNLPSLLCTPRDGSGCRVHAFGSRIDEDETLQPLLPRSRFGHPPSVRKGWFTSSRGLGSVALDRR